jgi:hypothetical protein
MPRTLLVVALQLARRDAPNGLYVSFNPTRPTSLPVIILTNGTRGVVVS